MAKNVTNPMTADLDGGEHDIIGAHSIIIDGHLTVGAGVIHLDTDHNRPTILWGAGDPRSDPSAAGLIPGTLYIQYAYQASGLWVQMNVTQESFRRVAMEP